MGVFCNIQFGGWGGEKILKYLYQEDIMDILFAVNSAPSE